ncbi:MAG TPA: discoidin domain-containing protein [Ignavibacteriaceae bacterium]|nr:discoidin domain-containing protein [Ignavibacteriaceae bacterium]
MKKHLTYPVIRSIFRLPILIIYFLFSGFLPSIYANTYYVSATASGSGSGSKSSPWTIYQAASNATAGDTVFLAAGTYALNSVLSFNNSGSASNPIVFRGVRIDEDERTTTTGNTYLRQDNSTTGGQISISGSYVTLENMVIRQQYPKYLITIGGSHATLDSVVTQYPSNVSDGSNHTIKTTADYTTLRYCYFWRSPRTVVWVEPIYPNTCDYFLMEHTTIAGFDNHYAIQLMPQTRSTPVPKVTNAIIRDCTFLDGGYESSLYIRNVFNCRIYNNLFINSLGRYADLQLFITDGIVQEAGYDAASIFANNTIYSTLVGGSGVKSASSILLMGDSNQNGWTIKNNVCSVADGTTPYRYVPNTTTTAGQGFSIDYNLIYVWNKSVTSLSSSWTLPNSSSTTSYSWSGWQSRGFDTHSIIDANPNFVNPTTNQSTWNFKLGTNITGEDLSSWGITTDRDGNPRDPNNPTIGAFEFTNGGGGGNIRPNPPAGPTPTNGAINQPISSTLSWNCSDPNGDPLTYSVYFGTTSNPPLVASNQSNASYVPGQLNNNTTYYWKIVAKDNLGATTSSPIWNFLTTGATGGGGNDVIPPKLIRVQCTQSDVVVLDFSEPLNKNLASNVGNYVISNQIHVLSAKIDSSLDRITLTTDAANVNQLYTVTVNNLADTAGNLISSQAHSLFYKLLEVGSTGYTNYLIDNVEASSTSDTNTSASKTLDGLVNGDPDPNSRWASQAMPQWIQFDLGAPQPVNIIAVSFYQWNNGRIYNYSIETSDDSVKWQQVVTNASSSSQEWTIKDFTNLTTRYIRIICLSNNQGDWAGIWEARILKSDKATPIEISNNVPQSFALEQNYPNPFNPTTNIRFSIPQESFVTLKVYDILGNEIATLVNERKPRGTYNVKFNASNLASGIYFCRIQASNFISTRKMILLK